MRLFGGHSAADPYGCVRARDTATQGCDTATKAFVLLRAAVEDIT
jgi:hypothetical protein